MHRFPVTVMPTAAEAVTASHRLAGRYRDQARWGEVAGMAGAVAVRVGRLPWPAVGAAIVGTVMLFVAVSVPWSTWNPDPLITDARQAAYNVPLLLLAVVGAGLLLKGRSTPAGVAMLSVAVVWLAAASVSDWARMLDVGTGGQWGWVSSPGHFLAGPWASLAGLLLLGAACITGWARRHVRLLVDGPSLRWAAASAALGVAWVVGEWMPWNTEMRTLEAGYTYNATGTQTIVHQCCVPFDTGTSVPTGIREALTMTGVMVLAIVAPFVLPRVASGNGIAAIGVAYLSESIVWLVGLSGSLELGQHEVSAEQSGALGGWVAAAACLGFILLGVFRMLSAVAAAHEATAEGDSSGPGPAEQGVSGGAPPASIVSPTRALPQSTGYASWQQAASGPGWGADLPSGLAGAWTVPDVAVNGPPAAAAQQAPVAPALASPSRRVLALTIDWLVVYSVALGLIYLGAFIWVPTSTPDRVYGIAIGVLVFGYRAVDQSLSGRTVGQRIVRIRVRGVERPLTAAGCFGRNALALVFVVIPFGAIALLASCGRACRRGWHDDAAGTVVVRS